MMTYLLPHFMYGSASYMLTAKTKDKLLRNTAYKRLEAIFISAIKKTLNLPIKGVTRPIKELFIQILPLHIIGKNYIRNFNRWKEITDTNRLLAK